VIPLLPDERVLRRMAGLRLQWRAGLTRSSVGSRRGSRPGSSRELLGLRAYQEGDDLRDIDWAATARFDRAHVRQYRHETDSTLLLLLDASASMGFGDPSKLDYARALACALGFLALAHHDRVGAVVFSDRVVTSLPVGRGRGQWRALADLVGDVTASGPTAFGDIAAALPRLGSPRGVALALSDFSPPEAFAAGLERLARANLSVVALHLLSREDLDPTIDGEVALVDLETGEARSGWVGAAQRAAYRSSLDRLRRQIASACEMAGGRHVEVSTATPVLRCLQETLVRAGVLTRKTA
jgi:uncharacterized protein (DUF58 family)